MYKKPVIGTKLILYENLIFNIGSINQLGIFEYNFLQILMVKIRKSKLNLKINLLKKDYLATDFFQCLKNNWTLS